MTRRSPIQIVGVRANELDHLLRADELMHPVRA